MTEKRRAVDTGERKISTTVYNCAQIKLTDPRDGATLWKMLLSMPTGDGHDQEQDSEYDTPIVSDIGKSIQDSAMTLGIARNTVRKYVRHPELVAMPHPRPNRRSKLDPVKEQVKQWISEDHCYTGEAMLPRLLAMGYTGSLSVLKAFVHPLRPPAGGHYPVIRYESKPGAPVQCDWGEFKYEQAGAPRKLYGFTAIRCYARMRFVSAVSRCDARP